MQRVFVVVQVPVVQKIVLVVLVGDNEFRQARCLNQLCVFSAPLTPFGFVVEQLFTVPLIAHRFTSSFWDHVLKHTAAQRGSYKVPLRGTGNISILS